MTLISRKDALDKYALPLKVYKSAVDRKAFATPEYGHADEEGLVRFIHRWLARVAKRIDRGAALTKEEQAYGKVKAAMAIHAPHGELLTPEVAVRATGAVGDAAEDQVAAARAAMNIGVEVNAQGLFDPVLVEKLATAELGKAPKAAENFAKVADAITKMAIAKQKKRLEDEKQAALASIPAAMKMTEGYSRHVVRGLETFAAQHVDRLAKETELPKETIRKVLAAAQQHWRTIHEDGIALVRARREELKAEAEAKAAKSGWR